MVPLSPAVHIVNVPSNCQTATFVTNGTGGGGTIATNSMILYYDGLQLACTPIGGGGGGGTTGGIGSNASGGGGIWTGAGTCSITNTVATIYLDTELEISEEEYLEHAEYWELARARGVQFRIRTAEEQRRREEEQRRLREQEIARQLERERAIETAKQLMLEHLTEEQREQFERHQWFEVRGGATGKRYRIQADGGYQHNIYEMQQNKKVADLCCHCDGDVPRYDHFLAQKISLMCNETEFLRIANRRAA